MINNIDKTLFPNDKMLQSYNCFHSSLGTYLNNLNEPLYDIKLSLHLQWQFFYHEQPHFNSEQRIIGEYPFIYDAQLSDNLKKILLYTIEIVKTKDFDCKNLDADIADCGYAILFVNKKIISKILDQSEQDESITTILISHLQEKNKYLFCKPNFFGVAQYNENGIISREDLKKARFSQIEGYSLQGDRIFCNKVVNQNKMNKKEYIYSNLHDVIDRYLSGYDSQIELMDSCWYGKKAMYYFSERIVHWPKIYEPEILFNRLDICAVGLIFVKRQRLVFFELIELIQKEKQIIIPPFVLLELKDLEQSILDTWGDLRMYMRLVCYKKQIAGLENISQYFKKISALEIKYLQLLKTCILE